MQEGKSFGVPESVVLVGKLIWQPKGRGGGRKEGRGKEKAKQKGLPEQRGALT